jgi:hypothetical protein
MDKKEVKEMREQDVAVARLSNIQALSHLSRIGSVAASILLRYQSIAQEMSDASTELWELIQQLVREGLVPPQASQVSAYSSQSDIGT